MAIADTSELRVDVDLDEADVGQVSVRFTGGCHLRRAPWGSGCAASVE